jgi:hypothetical protein
MEAVSEPFPLPRAPNRTDPPLAGWSNLLNLHGWAQRQQANVYFEDCPKWHWIDLKSDPLSSQGFPPCVPPEP